MHSTVKPKQIIIVASGQDIKGNLKRFGGYLNITYIHTQIIGQIAQKKIGIKTLNESITWCLFLDDDLVVDNGAIECALRAVKLSIYSNVIGVGFSLPSTSRLVKSKGPTLFLGKLLGVNSKKPGKVLRSGHATSYMQLQEVKETEWLNGASMWKTSVLNTYGLGIPSTRYAACEDLLFSYPLRKKGEMIFAPEAKLRFQDESLTNFDSFEIFESASYWRYFFVCQNNLSRTRFFVSQVGRISYIVLQTQNGKFSIFVKLIKLQNHILKSFFLRQSHEVLLQEFTTR
jgi:GT2 family glycosyltransferase